MWIFFMIHILFLDSCSFTLSIVYLICDMLILHHNMFIVLSLIHFLVVLIENI